MTINKWSSKPYNQNSICYLKMFLMLIALSMSLHTEKIESDRLRILSTKYPSETCTWDIVTSWLFKNLPWKNTAKTFCFERLSCTYLLQISFGNWKFNQYFKIKQQLFYLFMWQFVEAACRRYSTIRCVLEHFAKFTEKHLCWSPSFNRLAVWRPAN